MTRSISIRMSLLRDIAVLVVLLGLAILLAMSVGTRRTVRTLSESLMGQSLTTVEARLDTFFTEAQQQLVIARGQAEAGAFDTAEMAATAEAGFRAERDLRNRLLRPIVEQSPQISSVILADGLGREHMLLQDDGRWRSRCTSADEGDEVRWLEWSGDADPVERSEAIDYDPRTRPWYQGAVAAGPGVVHWTEPYSFFTLQEPGITVSSQFGDADGLERVIAFDVLLNDISEFTRHQGIGRTGIVAVLTADRRLVGLPGLESFDDPNVRASAYLKHPTDLGLTLIDDAVASQARQADSEDITFRFVSEGEVWWGCAQPYELSPERSLRVAILVPESELLGNLWLVRTAILSIIALVLVIGMWRAAVVARRFSAPVEALVAQSERITEGDLAPGDPIRSPLTEIRQLVDAQEHMREGIRARLKLEKVERDLDIARDIQHGLLPQNPPEVAGFEIAGWNQAADQTGGDFYDWIILPNGHLGVTLADVTGHGIGPALIVAVYRAYLRASTTFGSPQLSEAICHINDLLYEDLPDDRFITAVVGTLDPETGRMIMLSAGHAPLLYYEAATGTVHNWDADDVPLGIMRGLDLEEPRELAFAPGDTLVLVTDGFFEWANAAGEQFGTERLVAFVRDHQQLSAEQLIQALYRAVLDYAGGTEQGDDLTAVVIRRT